MSKEMWLSLTAIFITNIGLVIGATWRLSGIINKVVVQLVGIKELMDVNNKHTEQRMVSVETRTNLQDQILVDIQKRQTAMELEMKMILKRE